MLTLLMLAQETKAVPNSVVYAAYFLGIFILLYIFMIRIPLKRMKRRMETMHRTQEQTLHHDHKVRASLEEIMVEIEEMSRSVNARLETKMALLEQLIQEADQRIAEMQSQSMPQGVTQAAAPSPEAPTEDARYAEIYRLHDEQVPLQEIARMVEKTPGEIQLILGLRRNSKTAAKDEGVA